MFRLPALLAAVVFLAGLTPAQTPPQYPQEAKDLTTQATQLYR